MKRKAALWLCVLFLATLLCSPVAMATTPKVHITGPPKERGQIVGEEFVIGVAATGFDTGWVEIATAGDTQTLPMEKRKTNYLKYTPSQAGELTITAIVTQSGSERRWTSTVTTTVYPIDAQQRADWMVQTALSCVGSTDAAQFVRYTNLSAQDDWCAAFIGWCAKQIHIPQKAGLQAIFAGVDVYSGSTVPIACKTCRRNHQARFLATVLDKSLTLKPGDLVFFIWGSNEKGQLKAHEGYQSQWHGNANHVGLVTAVDGDGFTFVHGNVRMPHNQFGVALNRSSDEKEGKTYADWVVAFARPLYDYQNP